MAKIHDDIAAETGVTAAYARMLDNGTRTPSRDLAYEIHEKFGLKFGHLANMSDKDIATLRKLERA